MPKFSEVMVDLRHWETSFSSMYRKMKPVSYHGTELRWQNVLARFRNKTKRHLPGSLCFARLEVGVGGGVVPAPWAFDT